MLIAPTLSTRSFTWVPTSQSFVAESSELGSGAVGRIWDDACDVGFRLQSHRTGKEVLFCLDHEEKTPDGDIAGWRFLPVPVRGGEYQGLPLSVLIIND
jgi:hypothetical protein